MQNRASSAIKKALAGKKKKAIPGAFSAKERQRYKSEAGKKFRRKPGKVIPPLIDPVKLGQDFIRAGKIIGGKYSFSLKSEYDAISERAARPKKDWSTNVLTQRLMTKHILFILGKAVIPRRYSGLLNKLVAMSSEVKLENFDEYAYFFHFSPPGVELRKKYAPLAKQLGEERIRDMLELLRTTSEGGDLSEFLLEKHDNKADHIIKNGMARATQMLNALMLSRNENRN